MNDPQRLNTKQLYHEAEVILTLWENAVKHSEQTLQLKVHDGWKNQFNMLRVAVNKGDTVFIRIQIVAIATALTKVAANPKLMQQEFAEELMKS